MFGNRLIATDDMIFVCPFFDAGWCYASLEVTNSNDDCGQCNKPLECRYRQELIVKIVEESNMVDK